LDKDIKTIPLIGYCDRLSVRPNEEISFKVSSECKSDFNATLYRSFSSDPNPNGPRIQEEKAENFFSSKSFKSIKQNYFPGSYAISSEKLKINTQNSFKINVSFLSTLQNKAKQYLFEIDRLCIYIDENYQVSCNFYGQNISLPNKISIRNWYKIQLEFNALKKSVTLSQSDVNKQFTEVKNQTVIKNTPERIDGKVILAASGKEVKISNFFNGKIENPSVFIENTKNKFEPLVKWDLSKSIPTSIIKDSSGHKIDLKTINFPTRGVTGSKWDGSEMSWKHCPEHYTAIHFHEDDIYDFEWETSFTFKVPKGIPSGIYVMRISCEKYEDNIPFFVCPPKKQVTSNLCVIIPTFTYTVYGNHARPDYNDSWQEKIKKWNAYPYNPSSFKSYGLSTYNFHSDGSGICHASYLRPLLNLKVGYLTFGASDCSGLRHFQADSHLVSWLNNKDIKFDILTDEEVHNERYEVLKNYKTIMTTSHPEYHTKETLAAFHEYTGEGGNLIYLGGNGFYWKVCLHEENNKIIEIRRAEDGIRAWASEPGEYYNAFDGSYGGLWRRNGIPPQKLTGVGFSAQGQFTGSYYLRKNYDKEFNWVFKGINENKIGNFGLSGGGAAGFELDRVDYKLGTPENCKILASSEGHDSDYVLVPEEHLTHLTTVPGEPLKSLLRADMVYFENTNGGKVFSTGSITFCGSLPYNNFKNNISTLLGNILDNFSK
tara:strand:+ start:187 stop:2325 length:2139 start_codon:yes stop_codon:yes gene_type:complete